MEQGERMNIRYINDKKSIVKYFFDQNGIPFTGWDTNPKKYDRENKRWVPFPDFKVMEGRPVFRKLLRFKGLHQGRSSLYISLIDNEDNVYLAGRETIKLLLCKLSNGESCVRSDDKYWFDYVWTIKKRGRNYYLYIEGEK